MRHRAWLLVLAVARQTFLATGLKLQRGPAGSVLEASDGCLYRLVSLLPANSTAALLSHVTLQREGVEQVQLLRDRAGVYQALKVDLKGRPCQPSATAHLLPRGSSQTASGQNTSRGGLESNHSSLLRFKKKQAELANWGLEVAGVARDSATSAAFRGILARVEVATAAPTSTFNSSNASVENRLTTMTGSMEIDAIDAEAFAADTDCRNALRMAIAKLLNISVEYVKVNFTVPDATNQTLSFLQLEGGVAPLKRRVTANIKVSVPASENVDLRARRANVSAESFHSEISKRFREASLKGMLTAPHEPDVTKIQFGSYVDENEALEEERSLEVASASPAPAPSLVEAPAAAAAAAPAPMAPISPAVTAIENPDIEALSAKVDNLANQLDKALSKDRFAPPAPAVVLSPPYDFAPAMAPGPAQALHSPSQFAGEVGESALLPAPAPALLSYAPAESKTPPAPGMAPAPSTARASRLAGEVGESSLLPAPAPALLATPFAPSKTPPAPGMAPAPSTARASRLAGEVGESSLLPAPAPAHLASPFAPSKTPPAPGMAPAPSTARASRLAGEVGEFSLLPAPAPAHLASPFAPSKTPPAPGMAPGPSTARASWLAGEVGEFSFLPAPAPALLASPFAPSKTPPGSGMAPAPSTARASRLAGEVGESALLPSPAPALLASPFAPSKTPPPPGMAPAPNTARASQLAGEVGEFSLLPAPAPALLVTPSAPSKTSPAPGMESAPSTAGASRLAGEQGDFPLQPAPAPALSGHPTAPSKKRPAPGMAPAPSTARASRLAGEVGEPSLLPAHAPALSGRSTAGAPVQGMPAAKLDDKIATAASAPATAPASILALAPATAPAPALAHAPSPAPAPAVALPPVAAVAPPPAAEAAVQPLAYQQPPWAISGAPSGAETSQYRHRVVYDLDGKVLKDAIVESLDKVHEAIISQPPPVVNIEGPTINIVNNIPAYAGAQPCSDQTQKMAVPYQPVIKPFTVPRIQEPRLRGSYGNYMPSAMMSPSSRRRMIPSRDPAVIVQEKVYDRTIEQLQVMQNQVNIASKTRQNVLNSLQENVDKRLEEAKDNYAVAEKRIEVVARNTVNRTISATNEDALHQLEDLGTVADHLKEEAIDFRRTLSRIIAMDRNSTADVRNKILSLPGPAVIRHAMDEASTAASLLASVSSNADRAEQNQRQALATAQKAMQEVNHAANTTQAAEHLMEQFNIKVLQNWEKLKELEARVPRAAPAAAAPVGAADAQVEAAAPAAPVAPSPMAM